MDLAWLLVFKVVVGITAIAGAVLLSPGGTKYFLAWVQNGLRPPPESSAAPTTRYLDSRTQVDTDLRAELWRGSQTLEEQIGTLRDRIADVSTQMAAHRRECSARHEAVLKRLVAAESKLEGEAGRLGAVISDREREQARFDSHGLPVSALAVVLSLIPDQVASLPWVCAPCAAVALGIGFWAAISSRLSGAWRGPEAHAGVTPIVSAGKG